MVDRLEWDSDFFEFEVGKLILKDKDYYNSEFTSINFSKFKLIYVFSKNQLINDKLLLVDKKITYQKKVDSLISFSFLEDGFLLEYFDKNKHNFNQLKDLALESGKYSRFKIDENFINLEYEKLYSKWIENSVNDSKKCEVIILLNLNSEIIGFVTLNKNAGKFLNIGLIAVSNDYQGKGLGKMLLRAVNNRAFELGYSEIQVVTQQDNFPAKKLYENSEYELIDLTYIYHYWNL